MVDLEQDGRSRHYCTQHTGTIEFKGGPDTDPPVSWLARVWREAWAAADVGGFGDSHHNAVELCEFERATSTEEQSLN